MKIYRIKHKPSGLYWDSFNDILTKKGSIITYRPDLSIGLFVWTCDTAKTPVDKWTNVTILESELEIKEYELED